MRPQPALWLANIALFALFSLLYAARWVLFPREAALIFRHPVMSMFFGAIPMGLATIVNGFLAFGPDFLGTRPPSASRARFGRRMLRCRSSAASPSPIFMFTRQEHSMEKLTAVWLLPIVASEVAAASGGLLRRISRPPRVPGPCPQLRPLGVLGSARHERPRAAVPEACAAQAAATRDMGVSAWLALGPIGTGALGPHRARRRRARDFRRQRPRVRRRGRLRPRPDRRPDPVGLWRSGG